MEQITGIELRPLPPKVYHEFRRDVIFSCFKWDPQVGDANTIADHVIVISQATAEMLAERAEALAKETSALERALLSRPDLYRKLGLPPQIRKALTLTGAHLPERGVRVMRFDFHPTTTGWNVSEVNSDVPGGFSEAALLPNLAAQYFPGTSQFGHVGRHLAEALSKAIEKPGRVAFVYATSYADDRQVMQFLAQCGARRDEHCGRADRAAGCIGAVLSGGMAVGIAEIVRLARVFHPCRAGLQSCVGHSHPIQTSAPRLG
jgi:hypothetical protein